MTRSPLGSSTETDPLYMDRYDASEPGYLPAHAVGTRGQHTQSAHGQRVVTSWSGHGQVTVSACQHAHGGGTTPAAPDHLPSDAVSTADTKLSAAGLARSASLTRRRRWHLMTFSAFWCEIKINSLLLLPSAHTYLHAIEGGV